MAGSVYTEERFTMMDLGMNGPFGWLVFSYSQFALHFLMFELKAILNLQYVYC